MIKSLIVAKYVSKALEFFSFFFFLTLEDFGQPSSIWIYCMMSWLIMLIHAWWFCPSGKLGRSGHLELAAQLELIARNISLVVFVVGF